MINLAKSIKIFYTAKNLKKNIKFSYKTKNQKKNFFKRPKFVNKTAVLKLVQL